MSQNAIFVPKVFVQPQLYNLEEINILSQGWDNRWTMIKSGGVQAKLWVFTTPRMQLSWVGYDNGLMIEGSHPPKSVVISFVRTDGVCSFQNQKFEHYELMILKYGEDFNYTANHKNDIFTIVIEENFFNDEFYSYFGFYFEKIRKNFRLLLEKEEVDKFISKMQYWSLYFQKENLEILTLQSYFDIELSIVEELFSIIYLQEDRKTKKHLNIEKARKALKNNIENVYTIKNLAEELGMNVRTLQYHFKENLGISAKQYFQNLRLNAIRNELRMANSKEIKVSDIALKYGFFHASHFSTEYKKFFQETPSTTLFKNIAKIHSI